MSQSKPLVTITTTMRAAMQDGILKAIDKGVTISDAVIEGANISRNAGVKKAPSWAVRRGR